MKNENCWYKNVCEQECKSSCIRFLEMNHLVENSQIPVVNQYPKMLDAEDADYDAYCLLADIKDNIIDFVEGGGNLYIASNETGNGKTTWATKLMLKFFDEIWAGNGFRVRGLFLHVPTLLLRLKNFKDPLSEEFKANILNTDLVIWDDIAATDMSNYDLTQLLMFIDQRILNAKASIYTSNLATQQQLSEAVGQRLASRIWNTCEVVIFQGKDRRTA